MRKSKFSESTIVSLLKEAEAGRKVTDICTRTRNQQRNFLSVA